MIVTELYKELEDGTKLYKTYSDKGYKVRQKETNVLYDEAIDIENSGYTYGETRQKVEELPEIQEENIVVKEPEENIDLLVGKEE